ncbi:MAG: HAD-IIIA family hydrolase [Parvibaculum sp.]|nr:HAD-IIIA family hydrolase [Parvibaculum sp.]
MLLENGIWISSDTPRQSTSGAALFLDRDGVVVKEMNYLSRIEDVSLEHGIIELLAWAHGAGLATIIVTNQSGIARGLFDWATFEAVQAEVTRQLAAQGVSVDLTIACPFHDKFTRGYGPAQARWRKPGPAMLELGAAMTASDGRRSWMIGDRAGDMAAARNASLVGGVHVATSQGADERAAALALADEYFRVIEAAHPMDALQSLRKIFPNTSS